MNTYNHDGSCSLEIPELQIVPVEQGDDRPGQVVMDFDIEKEFTDLEKLEDESVVSVPQRPQWRH